MTCMDAKAMPTNDTNYSCHIKAIKLIYQSYGFYITPLVINSFGGGHTHTDVRKETILRKQVHAGLWPVRLGLKMP